MPVVTLRHAVVGAAKADFVKHSIRVLLDLPLTDETLKLRSKLAYLAMEKESITVTLESAQLPLFDDKPSSEQSIAKNFVDVIQTNVLPRVSSVTLSSGGKSVTLDENTRANADKMLNKSEHKARFTDQAQLKRERKSRKNKK